LWGLIKLKRASKEKRGEMLLEYELIPEALREWHRLFTFHMRGLYCMSSYVPDI